MAEQSKMFDSHLSYALAAAHLAVNRSLGERLKKHQIRIEACRVMECLDAGERLTMGELAKRALINPPTLSKLVDRMVSEGLVHRQIATEDQRQINLLLTSLGRMRMEQARKDVEEQDKALTTKLDEKDGEVLLKLLAKLA